MANTKHSVAREIIISRLLHEDCGHSLYELLDEVNNALRFEGFREVTVNTIRNDIENFKYLYKQDLVKERRGRCDYYRFKDPDATLYNNVLTFEEIQHLHAALMAIRFCDPLQGTMTFKHLSRRLSHMLELDPASDPIVLYNNLPSKSDCNRFRTIYRYIREKTPACITYFPENDMPQRESIIHPYYILNDEAKYFLLGHNSDENTPAKIPFSNITRMYAVRDMPYIPNKDFPLQDFYTKHFSRKQ
ncbi:hypothetical protein [Prevotella sp. P6B1]|uniref:hypothetical protein n=1 Tax=Prevotella sp. P6B1 TaxID=1410613 RepID=UPI00051C8969|nr:hypothetical protein [Prevotella sp. P6B1]